MASNFPNLMRTLKLKIQEIQQASSSINPKGNTPSHIRIKPLKTGVRRVPWVMLVEGWGARQPTCRGSNIIRRICFWKQYKQKTTERCPNTPERKTPSNPVFLSGESCGQRSLVGCCPWGHTGSDTTEAT